MAIHNKPDESVFASSARQGEVSNFPDISRGWGVSFDQTGGIPPMEWFNFLFKRTDEKFGYLFQRGLSEWSATQEYPIGALVQYKNLTYKAKRANTNKNPEQADSLDWQRWGFTQSELKSATLTESGVVQLESAVNSNSEDKAATPKAVSDVNTNANSRVLKRGDEMTGMLTISDSGSRYSANGNNWSKRIHFNGDAAIGNESCIVAFNNNGVLHLGGKPKASEFNASLSEGELSVKGDVRTSNGASLNNALMKSGGIVTGGIQFKAGDWSGIDLFNVAGNFVRLEGNPHNSSNMLSIVYRNSGGGNINTLSLPKRSGEIAIREEVVSDVRLGAVTSRTLGIDAWTNHWTGYVVTGFNNISDGLSYQDYVYLRPIQKYINGQWVTISNV
nr:MAG TPA: Baseplate structural protein [Caudoviricetes sp.]